MAAVLACPQCQRTLNVPAALSGQTVKCPGCGAQFTAATDGQCLPLPAPVPEPPPSSAAAELAPVYTAEPTPFQSVGPDEPAVREQDRVHPGRPQRKRLPAHRAGAVLAMGVISLSSLVLITCSGMMAVGPMFLGPIAWIWGRADLRAMREGRMDPEGEGQTRAGMICGIISTCLGIFLIVGSITLLVVLFAMGYLD
jgi:hypothetical protein